MRANCIAAILGLMGLLALMSPLAFTVNARGASPMKPVCQADTLSTPPYSLTRTHDSLYHLNDFRLPYPVYRFCTGDVDGDGTDEALVGVVKSTRFHPEKARRLFIFHLVDGMARPLWMGSKLGGILQDFRCTDNGCVRSLETTADNRYVVAEYRWEGFGLVFQRFLVKNTDRDTALSYFNAKSNKTD